MPAGEGEDIGIEQAVRVPAVPSGVADVGRLVAEADSGKNRPRTCDRNVQPIGKLQDNARFLVHYVDEPVRRFDEQAHPGQEDALVRSRLGRRPEGQQPGETEN